MELRPLGKTGLRVSAMSLGAMTFGESTTFMKGVTSPDDEARAVLDASLEAGINLIDTANVYSEGRSEELLGVWLEGRREEVVLATKCRFPIGFGTRKVGPHDSGLSRKHILKACEDSLRRLRTDYIDLYQVHMQDGTVPIEETLRALDDLVTSGKVRYIGCSNYTGYRLVESLWAADRLRSHSYASIQLQWSLVTRDAEREVVPACKRFGLGTLVWSPLARGFLSGKYKRGQAPPPGSRLEAWKDSMKSLDNDRNWAILARCEAIAAAHDSTAGSVALAWLLARSEVSSIILGVRDRAQLADNLRAASLKLSAEELKSLTDVSAPDWGYPYNFIGMREAW